MTIKNGKSDSVRQPFTSVRLQSKVADKKPQQASKKADEAVAQNPFGGDSFDGVETGGEGERLANESGAYSTESFIKRQRGSAQSKSAKKKLLGQRRTQLLQDFNQLRTDADKEGKGGQPWEHKPWEHNDAQQELHAQMRSVKKQLQQIDRQLQRGHLPEESIGTLGVVALLREQVRATSQMDVGTGKALAQLELAGEILPQNKAGHAVAMARIQLSATERKSAPDFGTQMAHFAPGALVAQLGLRLLGRTSSSPRAPVSPRLQPFQQIAGALGA